MISFGALHVNVPLIFPCPADHVLPDSQTRILLGMVEARSANVKNTTKIHIYVQVGPSVDTLKYHVVALS